MANLDNIPVDRLSSEHYRQMLVRDGERRFREWHGEFLRYQREYLRDLENRRKSIYADRKRRSQESRNEFLRYYYKFLAEMHRY